MTASPHPAPNLSDLTNDVVAIFADEGIEVSPALVREALDEFADRVKAGHPALWRRRLGLDPDPTPDSDPDPDSPRGDTTPPATGSGSGSSSGSVPFTYRVETLTPTGEWAVVRTQTGRTLTSLGRLTATILTNARPILGLGPQAPTPTIRVRAWNSRARLAGSALAAPTGHTTQTRPRLRAGLRRARLWLAVLLAPAGVDGHDPDDTECPGMQALLEAALWGELRHDGTCVWVPAAVAVADAVAAGLLRERKTAGKVNFRLTAAGELELARRWGPGRVPPWGGGTLTCRHHGPHDTPPGDRHGCPSCPPPTPSSHGVFSIRPLSA
jgi:hypothetical protein